MNHYINSSTGYITLDRANVAQLLNLLEPATYAVTIRQMLTDDDLDRHRYGGYYTPHLSFQDAIRYCLSSLLDDMVLPPDDHKHM